MLQIRDFTQSDRVTPEYVKRTNTTKICTADDILIARYGASLGKILTGLAGAYNVAIMRTIPNTKLLEKKYLYYYLKSSTFQYFILNIGSRAAQAGFNKNDLQDLLIPLVPKERQNEIVSILEKVETTISSRQQQLQKLDELVKARFVEMFGDPLSNTEHWPVLTLTQVCHNIVGGGTPSKSHPEYFTGTIPWVSPKDMKSSAILDSVDHITDDAISNSSTNLVPANSVLMVIRSGILKRYLPVAINCVPVTINQDMKAFIPSDVVTAEYLMYYFKSIEHDVLAGVRSVTADNIDFKAFQKRMIVVPPITLQKIFAVFVKQVDKSKAAIQKALDETQLLFDSLMQKYFG